jgi:hypothetical protein
MTASDTTVIDAARFEGTREGPEGPIALDGLAVGIDLLDAVLVFHLGDAHVHAQWVRPDGGVRPDEVVTTLRDAYRVGQFAGKRLAGASAAKADAPAPLLTIELTQRTALLRRVRAYVVACIYDAAMPLGMARLIAERIVAAVSPELPREDMLAESVRARVPLPARTPDPVVRASVAESTPDRVAPAGAAPRHTPGSAPPPNTLNFGTGRPKSDTPKPPLGALPRRSRPPAEMDRLSRLIAYLEAHAPEPHVVRHRLALRAGLTLAALERPATLGPEAVVLIETAVQDILGIDRAELRRIA